ncbi:unnamed protein product [Bathycoccus prasinos]
MSAPRGREKTVRPMRIIAFISKLFFVILFVYFSASGGVVSGQEEGDDGEDNNDDGKNTFWNTGPSGIDETLLPPLDPTNYPCPTDRYLLLGPRTYTGGFNNMFMTFQSAILLARYTNRTFVIPAARNDRYTDFRFSQAIDYEAMRPVWPCFHDTNVPWGEGEVPQAYVSVEKRRKLAMVDARSEEDRMNTKDDFSTSALLIREFDELDAKRMVHADGDNEDEEEKQNEKEKNNKNNQVIAGRTNERKLLVKGKKLKTSDMFDDFKPKPNSVAAMRPARVRGPDNTGRQISEIASDFTSDAEVHGHPVIMISGSAWGGLMTACMKPHEDGLFFKHVQPAEHIRQEVEMYKQMRGLVDGEYVGVHLRYLEGKCPHRARAYYMPKVEKQIAAMCHNTFPHTQRVLQDHGIDLKSGTKIYLASDRQRPDADKSFEKAGSISYDKGNKKDKYFGDGTQFVKGYIGKKVFEPAVDMFILAGAKIFVGNMLSTFSTNTANIRYGWGARRSVLAWPEPPIMKERSFWECERAAFWCGTITKEWSSEGHTKAKGNC